MLGLLLLLPGSHASTQELDLGDGLGDASALDALLEEVAEVERLSTATGYSQMIDRSPSTAFVMGRQQIESINPKHVGDLLRYIPGFMVLRNQEYGYRISAMGTPGPAANKVLFLIDGHRAAQPAIGGPGFEYLPLSVDELDRVEVILGPQSAIYGSSALSAVVNYITRRPRGEESSHVAVRAGNRGFHQETVLVSSRGRKGQTRALFQHESLGGYGALATVEGLSSPVYPRGGVMGRQVGRISHSQRLERDLNMDFSLGVVDLRSDGLALGNRGLGDLDSDAQSIYGTLDLTRTIDQNRSLQLRSTLYRVTQFYSQPPFGSSGIADQDRGEFSLDNELRYDFGVGSWRLNSGFAFRHAEVTGYPIVPGGARANTRTVFVNGERELGERWVLFLGALSTFQDLGDDATSWKISGLYRPNRRSGVRLSLGTSFKDPDLAGTSIRSIQSLPAPAGPRPTTVPVIQANTNVVNSVSKGFVQVGYELRPHKDQRLKLDFFRSEYGNNLSFSPTGVPIFFQLPGPPFVAPTGQIQRAPANSQDSATVRGVTVSYERPVGAFLLTLQGYGQSLKSSGPSIDLGNVPNRGGSLLLEYRAQGNDLGGSLSWIGVGSYAADQFSLQQGFPTQLPGYGMVDVNLSKRLGEETRLSFTVNNLFDQRHLEVGPLITLRPPGVGAGTVFGRTAWVSVERKF